MGALREIMMFLNGIGVFDVLIPMILLWGILLFIGLRKFLKNQSPLKKAFIIVGVWFGAKAIAYIYMGIFQELSIFSEYYLLLCYLLILLLDIYAYQIAKG